MCWCDKSAIKNSVFLLLTDILKPFSRLNIKTKVQQAVSCTLLSRHLVVACATAAQSLIQRASNSLLPLKLSDICLLV